MLLPGILLGQAREHWVARYDGPAGLSDAAADVAVDEAGNVYVTGMSRQGGTGYDYVTIKYDGHGTILWVARYDGVDGGGDGATALALDEEGNVYVVGRSWGGGDPFDSDLATVKYDSQGNELWAARYDRPSAFGESGPFVRADSLGGLYVTASIYRGRSYEDYDFLTIRYGPSGEELWVAQYNGPGDGTDVPYALTLDPAGYVYVAGNSAGATTVKYDSLGQELWVARYVGPNGRARASAAALDEAGNLYVTGATYVYAHHASDDYATLKYDPEGNLLWVATYDGPPGGDDGAASLVLDPAGGVLVTGRSEGVRSAGMFDIATLRYSAAGELLWAVRYDGLGREDDLARAIALDGSGNVYVAGTSRGPGTGRDYALVKYTAGGTELRAHRYDGPAHGSDQVYALAVDDSGNYYITGQSTGEAGYYDYATLKNAPPPVALTSLPDTARVIPGDTLLLSLEVRNLSTIERTPLIQVALQAELPGGQLVPLRGPLPAAGFRLGPSGGVSAGFALAVPRRAPVGLSALLRSSVVEFGSAIPYVEDTSFVLVVGPGLREEAGGLARWGGLEVISGPEWRDLDQEDSPSRRQDDRTWMGLDGLALVEDYPNPFAPGAAITYGWSGRSGEMLTVSFAIYDLRGRLVRKLVSREEQPGRYSVQWDGRDEWGIPASRGIYLTRLRVGDRVAVRRMLLAR